MPAPARRMPAALAARRMLAARAGYGSHWTPHSLWATAARSSQARSAASRSRSGIALACRGSLVGCAYGLARALSLSMAVSQARAYGLCTLLTPRKL